MCDETWTWGPEHFSDQYRLINYTEYLESKFLVNTKLACHIHSLYFKIDDKGLRILKSVYCYNPRTQEQKQIWTCNKK